MGAVAPPMTLSAEQRRAVMWLGVSVQCRRVLKVDYRATEDVISSAPPVFNPIRGRCSSRVPLRLIIWHQIGGCS